MRRPTSDEAQAHDRDLLAYLEFERRASTRESQVDDALRDAERRGERGGGESEGLDLTAGRPEVAARDARVGGGDARPATAARGRIAARPAYTIASAQT